MDDIKKTAREAGDDAKSAWRKADGESLGDKAADARDRASTAVKNAGDDLHRETDKASRDVAYEEGRVDEATRRDEPA